MSKAGNEQVAVSFELIDHPGESVTWYGSFSEKRGENAKSTPFERTIESLRHMGWEGSDLTQLDGLDVNEVQLVVEHDEWDGRTYPKVKWVNAGGGLALARPLDVGQRQSFAQRMKGRILALEQGCPPRRTANGGARPNGGGSGPAPAPAAAAGQAAAGVDDDDIPF